MKKVKTCDFLVIGGGIIGLNLARELKKKFQDSRVTLLEKEPACGMHASSRNSGVLHAGFYYSTDSLKARFTREGNQMLTQYCLEKKLPLNLCGKLVVTQNEEELKTLEVLRQRAEANGIPIEEISEEDLHRFEPRAKTCRKALFSQTTATIDPKAVLSAQKQDAQREGIEIHEGISYQGRTNGRIRTSRGEYECGYLVNCAGLYADRIAQGFGFSQRYRILPFKGLYLRSEEPPFAFKRHIYPVPDLRYPFLGVHVTVTVEGHAKIGPTAIPAFWREQYDGMSNFDLTDFFEVVVRQTGLCLFSGFDFAKLAFTEFQKRCRPVLVRLASRLAKGIRVAQYREWGIPGIRAQLVNIHERKLEMDFVIEGDRKSCHVLNVVSPGLTCSLPFTRYVSEQIEGYLN